MEIPVRATTNAISRNGSERRISAASVQIGRLMNVVSIPLLISEAWCSHWLAFVVIVSERLTRTLGMHQHRAVFEWQEEHHHSRQQQRNKM